jgi:4'-phosphopantetheinyl transferase
MEKVAPFSARWLDLPSIQGTLTRNDIHLWLIPLDQQQDIVQTCATILPPDETARAQRFHFPHLRTRFIVAHAALRHILATYLDVAPQALTFEYTSQGKPGLSPEFNPDHLTFNLSHSRDLAILAITQESRIGVDLEHREPKRDLAQIAARNFSPTEATAFFSLPEHQRTSAFYACWTLKEAYLKATGDGLSTQLDSFDVTFPPVTAPSLARIGSSPDEHLRWQALSFTVENHAAALVVEGQEHAIYRAEWSA